MKIRAQIGMVLNLDKCIGCHTCSVVCKNVWTQREGVEYAWFNNVETKPGVGYPQQWENQEHWKGGWIRKINGQLQPKLGGRAAVLSHIFANRVMPEVKDYYEPFSFNYHHLQQAPSSRHQPIARPYSLLNGKTMDKIEQGPNWEDMLGGAFDQRSQDQNFANIEKSIYAEFEQSFMLHLPRLCEHCLNPACVATCPSGAIYKREEDGVVLIDQDRCRGWRLCVSGCPYKKIYFNWKSGKSEKCILCYPRLESGQPTLCSESCVGRIRYLGILLYDADRIEDIAKTEDPKQLYQQQCSLFLDPHDPEVQQTARQQGIPHSVLEAAQRSPVYKMAIDWQLALPLHPEYRTLPMVWYIPALSPIQQQVQQQGKAHFPHKGELPDIDQLTIPLQYLANLFTAGDTVPVANALKRLLAMRHFKRSQQVDQEENLAVLNAVGLSIEQVEEMYRYLAIANYEDRFVIPSSHRELAQRQFPDMKSCGFTFGDGCQGSDSRANLFDSRRIDSVTISPTPRSRESSS